MADGVLGSGSRLCRPDLPGRRVTLEGPLDKRRGDAPCKGGAPEPVALTEGHAELPELTRLALRLNPSATRTAPVFAAKWTIPAMSA